MPETQAAMNAMSSGSFTSPWDRISGHELINPTNSPFMSALPVGTAPDLDINEVTMLAAESLWGTASISSWFSQCDNFPGEYAGLCAQQMQQASMDTNYGSLLSAYDIAGDNRQIYVQRDRPVQFFDSNNDSRKPPEVFVRSFSDGAERQRGAAAPARSPASRPAGPAAGGLVPAGFAASRIPRILQNLQAMSRRGLPGQSQFRPPSRVRRLYCPQTATDTNMNCIDDKHEMRGDLGIHLYAHYRLSSPTYGGAGFLYQGATSQPVRVKSAVGLSSGGSNNSSSTDTLRPSGSVRPAAPAAAATMASAPMFHPVADASEAEAVRANRYLEQAGLVFCPVVDEWIVTHAAGQVPAAAAVVNLLARAEGVAESDSRPYVPRAAGLKAYAQGDEERCTPCSFCTAASILNATFDRSLSDACDCPHTRYSTRFLYLLQRVAECPYRCRCNAQDMHLYDPRIGTTADASSSQQHFASVAPLSNKASEMVASRSDECNGSCDPRCGALLSVVAKVMIEDGTVPETVWEDTQNYDDGERGGAARNNAVRTALESGVAGSRIMFLGGWARLDAFQHPALVLHGIRRSLTAGYPVVLNLRVFPNQVRMLQSKVAPRTCNETPSRPRACLHPSGTSAQASRVDVRSARVAAGGFTESSGGANAWEVRSDVYFDVPTMRRASAGSVSSRDLPASDPAGGARPFNGRLERMMAPFRVACGSNAEHAVESAALPTQPAQRRFSVAGGLSKACAHNVYHQVFSLPAPHGDSAYMGHCVTVVGYSDRYGALHVRNSFGEQWGAAGDFNIPYDLFGVDSCDVHAFSPSAVQLDRAPARLVHDVITLLPRSHTA